MQEFVTPIKGLNTDVHEMNKDSKTYSFLLNGTVEDFTGEDFLIGNEPSNLFTIALNKREDVIGKLFINELDEILLFTVEQQIGRIRKINPIKYTDYYQNNSVFNQGVENTPLEKKPLIPLSSSTVIVESDKFNWSINHPIKIQYKRTDCSINLYFIDKNNPDRFLYLNDDFSLNENFKDSLGNLDVNKTNWYPNISAPYSEVDIVSGGNLKAGSYQVLFSYATSKGIALSNYISASNPIPIKTERVSLTYDYETNQALKIKVFNVSGYKYLNIVIAETINGFTTYKLATTIPATVNEYVYTGSSKAIQLTESEIFQLYPYYKFSEDITIANNTLFKSNLVEFDKINIQRIANKFVNKVNWCTVVLKEGDYAKPEIAQKYKTYLRDETYVLGIELFTDRGEYTPVGIIPGRTIKDSDLEDIVNSPNINDVVQDEDNCNVFQRKKWQIYNTASKTYTNTLVYDNCFPKIYEEGEFAYVESTDLYPNNKEVWGDLANTPIRHHKFPDSLVTHIHKDGYIFPLGIKLKDGVNVEQILVECVQEGILTQEQFKSIKGYRIVRGNRVGNETIEARGLLFNTFEYEDENQKYVYPNYPFNDLRKDVFLLKKKLDAKTTIDFFTGKDVYQTYTPNRKYTFVSPETSFNTPALGNILKIETNEYGEAQGFFNQSEEQAEYKLLSSGHYNLAIVLGTILGEAIEFDDGSGQAANMGQGIGSILGGAVGSTLAPGIGTAIGSSLGGVLGGLVGGAISKNNQLEDFWRANVILSQCEKILQLFTLLSKGKNYAWQYQAVGKYDKSVSVLNNGNKQRQIKTSEYLSKGKQSIDVNTFFNNTSRETSVYLELNKDIEIPTIRDTSRFTIRNSSKGCDLLENEVVISSVSSYYTTIKRNILNQYGNVFSIEWLPISDRVWNLSERFCEFGGDSFIGRFSQKRKHSFFTRSAFKLPNDTEIFYEDYPNVAFPTFFFNTRYRDDNLVNFTNVDDNPLIKLLIQTLTTGQLPQNIINTVISSPTTNEANPLLLLIPGVGLPLFFFKKYGGISQWEAYLSDIGQFFRGSLLSPFNIIKPPKYLLDCYGDSFGNLLGNTGTWFNLSPVNGKMYLYSYGIPYFMCESGINLDLRHAENSTDKTFYPLQSDLDWWLQEKNVSPEIDNYYLYNKDYSIQNKQQIILQNDINFSPSKSCKVERPNRVIFSQQGAEIEDVDLKDSYLYFKALDMKDFELKRGKLIALHQIENEKILVQFENGSTLLNAFQTVNTDAGTIAISSGDLFKSRAMNFSVTDLGNMGTQHEAFISTPFGHVFVDAKRGQIFLLSAQGTQMQEISNRGRKNWFKENLPFTISNYFPNIYTDNAFKGIGLLLAYDARFNRVFLTKLDYLPLTNKITYNETNKEFYVDGIAVSLRDKRYFCDKSWTTSYNFNTQSWVSMHSFKPSYYIERQDTFLTGLNGNGLGASSLWLHNATNKSYQVYFGVKHPFIVEMKSNPTLRNQKVESVEYFVDVVRYHRDFDKYYSREEGFNKAVVYTRNQNSGVLFLKPNNKDSLKEFLAYPRATINGTEILVNSYKNGYQFNDIENKVLSEDNNLPIWISSCNNVDKFVNLAAVKTLGNKINNNYIEGNDVYVRLINDNDTNKKLIFKGLNIQTNG